MQLISNKNKERFKDSLFPLIFCLIGLLMLIFVQPQLRAGIPNYSTLKHVNGLVLSIYRSQGKSPYIEFHLKDCNHVFVYSSIGDQFQLVGNSLERAMLDVKPIEILYDRNGFTSFFSRKVSYDVWQLNIEGKSIRSYSDISAVYEANNHFGQIMCRIFGAVFLLLGVLTGYAFWKKHIFRNQL